MSKKTIYFLKRKSTGRKLANLAEHDTIMQKPGPKSHMRPPGEWAPFFHIGTLKETIPAAEEISLGIDARRRWRMYCGEMIVYCREGGKTAAYAALPAPKSTGEWETYVDSDEQTLTLPVWNPCTYDLDPQEHPLVCCRQNHEGDYILEPPLASVAQTTRLNILHGTAIGGMTWGPGKDITNEEMPDEEIQRQPCFATDLAVQQQPVDEYDSVAMQKEYPAIYGKSLGQSIDEGRGMWIPHPTVIRNMNEMATVTHSFRHWWHGLPSHYRMLCTASGQTRFAIGKNEHYGPHYVFDDYDYSYVLHPTHETIYEEPFWREEALAPLYLYRSPVLEEGWIVSRNLGIAYRKLKLLDPSTSATRFPRPLPSADGEEVEAVEGTGKLSFYFPRWESENEYGAYLPVGNLNDYIDVQGTFYFGNPQWQTQAEGVSPTLTKASNIPGGTYVEYGQNQYDYIAQEGYESLKNGRMNGIDGKWWELKPQTTIEDEEDFTLVEFALDEEERKVATGAEAAYGFVGYTEAPKDQKEPVWLVTPGILTEGLSYE